MKERLPYISGIKCIAFLTVVITHFLANECSEAFKYWEVGTYGIGWILAIFKGKIGVTIFCVTSGFLAAHAINTRKSDIVDSTVKRYVRFALNLLAVNVIYFFSQKIYLYFSLPFSYGGQLSFINCVTDGIFLLGKVNSPLWVIKDLFVGYISAMILVEYFKSYKYRYIFYIGIILVLFLCNMLWLFSIMLGMLLNCLLHDGKKALERLEHGKVVTSIIIKLCFAWFLYIQQEENLRRFVYFEYGIGSFLVLWVICDSKVAQEVLSNRFLTALDSYSFETYLLHIWVLYFIIPIVKAAFFNMHIVALFLMYIAIVMTAAVFYKKLISRKIDALGKRVVLNRYPRRLQDSD